MEEKTNQLNKIIEQMTDKDKKKYSVENLINLLKKTDLKDDELVSHLIDLMIDHLQAIKSGKIEKKQQYLKLFKELKKHVKEKYGYVQKGSVQGEYMSLGIAFGLMIGVAFSTINTAFIAIGLPIGVALGLSLGTQKEKELEKDDKLY